MFVISMWNFLRIQNIAAFIIKSASATANGKQGIKTCYMEDIMLAYEVDIDNVDIKFLKPSGSLEGGDNSIWGYLPGWLLKPAYATSCIRGEIYN
jgi:hypothetical protein